MWLIVALLYTVLVGGSIAFGAWRIAKGAADKGILDMTPASAKMRVLSIGVPAVVLLAGVCFLAVLLTQTEFAQGVDASIRMFIVWAAIVPTVSFAVFLYAVYRRADQL